MTTCKNCIHKGYCMEGSARGPCREYETDKAKQEEYVYWWKECHWWEMKEGKKK